MENQIQLQLHKFFIINYNYVIGPNPARPSPGRENQFPNRVCQRGALLCKTVPCDAMTSAFVSELFTVRLDDKGQTMLVICIQLTLSKKAKQSILTRGNFFLQIVYKCTKCDIKKIVN